MATPISPTTRLFIGTTDPEKAIRAGQYYTDCAKKFKLDEGIVKSFFQSVRAGEDPNTEDLDTPAQKKAGKEMIKAMKAACKDHAANKEQFEKNEAAAKEKAKAEKQQAKEAIIKDKETSALMLNEELSDEFLLAAQVQLTEKSIETIKEGVSEKFVFGENGLITIDPANAPDKSDFAKAFATVTTMVKSGATVVDSASKAEAQIGFAAKATLGESWVNLFSARPQDLSRIQKGVKVFEVISAFKSKKAKALFGVLDFTTTRALLEFKVTTAEAEGSAEKANEKNIEAKKELYLQAAEVLDKKREQDSAAKLTQAEAKKLVQDYKTGKGIAPPQKMKFIHVMHIDKKLKVFGTPELVKDNVRLSLLSFDSDCNRLVLSKDGKNVEKIPVAVADSETMKFLTDNASPPELSKEEKLAAARAEKEANKANKKNGKKASDDEQEEDVKAVVTGGVADDDEEDTTPVTEEEADADADTDEEDTSDADSDDDDDVTPAPKGSVIVDDEE